MSKLINGFWVGPAGDHVYFVKDGKQCRRKRPVFDKTKPVSESTQGIRNEFGKIQGAVKLFKLAFEDVVKWTNDTDLHSNLIKILIKVKNCDRGTNGTRSVHGGLNTETGLSILKEFAFVKNTNIKSSIYGKIELNKAAGLLKINNLIPRNCSNKRIDQYGYILYWAKINFEDLTYNVQKSDYITVVGNSFDPIDLVMAVEKIPEGTGVNFIVLFCTYSEQTSANRFQPISRDLAQIMDIF